MSLLAHKTLFQWKDCILHTLITKFVGTCSFPYQSKDPFSIQKGSRFSLNILLVRKANMEVDIPQSSVLGVTLYLLYTRDLPQDQGTCSFLCRWFCIMATAVTVEEVTSKLQRTLGEVRRNQPANVNFTNKKVESFKVLI